MHRRGHENINDGGADIPDIAMVPYRYEYLINHDSAYSYNGPPKMYKEHGHNQHKNGHSSVNYKHYCLYTGKYCRYCYIDEFEEYDTLRYVMSQIIYQRKRVDNLLIIFI